MTKLGENIRSLRKDWGESQLDLAIFLDANTSTVSQWENGKRIPSNEVLSKIALRYQVTLDDLLNRDYSDSPTMVDFFVKLREKGGGLLNDLRLLFPIVASRSDKENPKFMKALEIHKKFFSEGDEDFNSDVMMDLYYYLYEEESSLAAGANLLSILLVSAIFVKIQPYFEELTEYFSEKSGSDSRKSARFLLSNYVVNSSELVDGSDDDVVALKESDEFILPIIEKLKNSVSFARLGDYFFCMRYVYGLVDNELSNILNQQIGIHLMYDLTLIHNPYAIKYLNFYKKVLK